MSDTIASSWSTARCWVRDSVPSDAADLTRLYNSCSDLGAVDPSFQVIDEQVILGYIAVSVSAADRVFRLQVVGLNGSDERIGYFHLSHHRPRPEIALLSMFVLGVEYQGRRYGREVALGLVDQLCRLSWCKAVWLKVYLGNQRAMRHWVEAGFRHIEEVRTHGGGAESDPPCLILSYICPASQG
jgi:RimJ/RimL family protein N-acetyltransferase